jgi:hypothetical protein
MYLVLLDFDTHPFRFFPYLILPVAAIAIIALGIYLLRHRIGRKRS